MRDIPPMNAEGRRRAVRSRAAGMTQALLTVIALVACSTPSLLAQAADDGEIVAAGERYRAGPLHRWILGRHYRDVWTQIIRVERLDLSSFAGGLEPLRTGGGRQTRSLRFRGADGREYAFRSVDKDPSAVIDSLFAGRSSMSSSRTGSALPTPTALWSLRRSWKRRESCTWSPSSG